MNNNKEQNGVIISAPQQGFNLLDREQFEIMQRACKLLASSDLVPEIYQTKYEAIPSGATKEQTEAIVAKNTAAHTKAIANCMVALEISQRIGASPLMVMQNMTVIHGKPSWSSKFLIGTVNACGRYNPLKFKFIEKGALGVVDYIEYVWNESTRKKTPRTQHFDGKNIQDLECIAWTTAKGSDEVLEGSPVSIRMAIQEGWYTKSGSKWQTMAKQMLMYRAASFWTSAYAPELSLGMRTTEEVQDITDIDYIDVTAEAIEQEKRENANKKMIGSGLHAANKEIEQNNPERVKEESAKTEPVAASKVEPEKQESKEQKKPDF